MPNRTPSAVLCGDLNMLRCFDDTRIQTILVSSEPGNLALHSRRCKAKHAVADPCVHPERTLGELVRIGRDLSPKPVLFYGNDALLLLVSRQRELLGEYYRFLIPAVDMVESLASKTRFTSLARRYGWPVPRTVCSAEISDPDDALRIVSLPCILKPESHVGWSAARVVGDAAVHAQKALRADTREQFHELYAAMRADTDRFIVQQCVPGGPECIYSFHSYFDPRSNPRAYFVGHKIRTYPKESGASSYIELVHEPEVVRLGLEILKSLKFVGLSKLDFKKDPTRNRFYLLEINARFTLWNHLGARCGINLPHLAYCDLTGLEYQADRDYQTGVRWLSFVDDLRGFIRHYHPDGDLSWAQWLLSLRGPKIYDVFSWRDPSPFMAGLVEGGGIRLRKLMRSLSRRPAPVL
ncbi:MAG TPA: hypothetical protein VHP11_01085, partial [Tepidisphaeraceae bacterium]|nr:hypothetical protein [Tepidisphaeraceae bacterium]